MLFSPNEAGGIYIVSWENSYDYVKIGMAQNFTRRLEDFLVYSPFKLNIELLFPISSTDTETWVHSQ